MCVWGDGVPYAQYVPLNMICHKSKLTSEVIVETTSQTHRACYVESNPVCDKHPAVTPVEKGNFVGVSILSGGAIRQKFRGWNVNNLGTWLPKLLTSDVSKQAHYDQIAQSPLGSSHKAAPQASSGAGSEPEGPAKRKASLA